MKRIMKKKIVIVLNSEPKWGGEYQYVSTLMECMIKVKNIEIYALCSNRYWKIWCKEHEIRILDVKWPVLSKKEREYHIRYPLFSRIAIMYTTEFGKRIREEKIDAVLFTTQGGFIPNLGIKVIVPVHDLMHRYEDRFPEISEGYDSKEQIFLSKAKYAWCIITESEVGKKQFVESYSKYMGRKQPHIVSIPYIAPIDMIRLEEDFIETPAKYVFYPAQFWQHKNHINLIRAIELLVADIPDIHLILVGSEKNNLRKVRKYISEHNLEGYVTIKGFVSNGNLKYLYRHAVGMVMPSYCGPTNIPPLEAMALGCPVAVSNKYAMPEQVGNAGLLFDPDSPEEMAECIRKMWQNEGLRQEMIRKGLERSLKWTSKEFESRIRNIITKL